MNIAVIMLMLATQPSTSYLTLRVPDGILTARYDDARVSRKQVSAWMQFSQYVIPYNYLLVPESLDSCSEQTPAYLPCGSRAIGDPNFMHNAAVNLSRMRHRIATLHAGYFPVELRPVVDYVIQIQESELAIESAEYKFLQTADASYLSLTVGRVNLGDACANSVSKIISQRNMHAKYQVLSTTWISCANHHVRADVGEYPRHAWETFLARYSIQEEFIPREPS